MHFNAVCFQQFVLFDSFWNRIEIWRFHIWSGKHSRSFDIFPLMGRKRMFNSYSKFIILLIFYVWWRVTILSPLTKFKFDCGDLKHPFPFSWNSISATDLFLEFIQKIVESQRLLFSVILTIWCELLNLYWISKPLFFTNDLILVF